MSHSRYRDLSSSQDVQKDVALDKDLRHPGSALPQTPCTDHCPKIHTKTSQLDFLGPKQGCLQCTLHKQVLTSMAVSSLWCSASGRGVPTGQQLCACSMGKGRSWQKNSLVLV